MMLFSKFALPRPLLVMLTGIYCLLLLNFSFWEKTYAVFADFPLVYACFAIGISCLFLAFLLLFAWPYLTKPFLVFMVMSAAAASYFMDNLGTVITPEIVIDSLATTTNEGRALLTGSLFKHIAFFGVLPSVIITLVKIEPKPFLKMFWHGAKYGLVLIGITLGAIAIQSASIVSSIRENRDIIRYFNPVSPWVSMFKGVRRTYFNKPVVQAKLGTDAKPGPWLSAQSKPNLTVIVVGETARAQNFSLLGYDKPTNPELAKRNDLIVFSDMSSCGTLTADSLPCMFSNLTRAGFSRANAAANENLLNVINYAGIKPQWIEANTGSKGVALAFGETMLGVGNDPRFCRLNECDDRVLVDKVKQIIPTITKNTVLVLHQIGNHGPAYFMRYPESFKPFGPDCQSSDFKKCTREQVVNAYDNAIAFTDKTLADIITLLSSADDKMSSTMMYISDHGESLGELGLYLHGVPYFMAPKEQTQVPFITWASPSYLESRNTNVDCLRTKANDATSHDNFFHTVLGITGVTTSVYKPRMDLFSQCWEKTTQ